MTNKEKANGVVYTPLNIVRQMLDMCGYTKSNEDILCKHVIDNSCGEGAFLTEIVRRLVYVCEKKLLAYVDIRKTLESYVHGIEVDNESRLACIKNLNRTLLDIGLDMNVDWDIRCCNALLCGDYNEKMDYVVGNPPYVRVQSLKKDEELYNSVKSYSFCSRGSCDLYLAFYELGLKMLSKNGVLCYISPSGWMKGPAGKEMRVHIKKSMCLAEIYDFKAEQVFENVTTYVAITKLSRKINGKIIYSSVDEEAPSNISYENAFIGDELFLLPEKDFRMVEEIETWDGKVNYRVKNGAATLLDNFFFYKKPKGLLEVPAYKISNGEKRFCFFPHDTYTGEALDEESIKSRSPKSWEYIKENEKQLKKRDYDGIWYAFGRKQGLADISRPKITINTIIRSTNDLKIRVLVPGVVAYSGLYVLFDYTSSEESVRKVNDVTRALTSEDFMVYVKALGKYKNGGYYTFTSRQIEKFLNWKIRH